MSLRGFENRGGNGMNRQKKLFSEPKPQRRRGGKKWDISVEEFRVIIGAGDVILEDRDAGKSQSTGRLHKIRTKSDS